MCSLRYILLDGLLFSVNHYCFVLLSQCLIYLNKITAMSRNLPILLSEASMCEIIHRENGGKHLARFYLFLKEKSHNCVIYEYKMTAGMSQ